MPDLDAVIARSMRRRRVDRGWRQTDLSKHLQWPLSRVTRIETGQQRVQLNDVRDLCRVFQVPLVEMLAGADPRDLAALQLPELSLL